MRQIQDRYSYELINDYLDGLVDHETARAMSELLAKDETARSIAEGILFMKKHFSTSEEVEGYLRNLHTRQAELIEERTANRKSTRIWTKAAAAVTLLIALTIVLQWNGKRDAIAMVDDELSKPYPASYVMRGEQEASSLSIALGHYTSGNFREALPYFEKATAESSDQATRAFYQGLSLLYLQEYNNAIELLQDHQVAGSRYAEAAEWMTVLATVKAGETTKAKEMLGNIADDKNHYKREAATALLKSLR